MTNFYDPKEIIPGLWIGSQATSQDPKFMKKNRIELVVNCTRNIPNVMSNVQYASVPVDDADDEQKHFLKAVPLALIKMRAAMRRGAGVLVHCYAGISRSSSVVAAYLIKYHRLSTRDAILYIKRQKPETFSQGIVFMPALKHIEKVENGNAGRSAK